MSGALTRDIGGSQNGGPSKLVVFFWLLCTYEPKAGLFIILNPCLGLRQRVVSLAAFGLAGPTLHFEEPSGSKGFP